MGKKFDEKPKEKFVSPIGDLNAYKAYIEGRKNADVNGVKLSPREQYLYKQAALNVKDGEIRCADPMEWQIVDEMDWKVPRQEFIPPKGYFTEIFAKLKDKFIAPKIDDPLMDF